MPELPEVETVKLGLKRLILGRRISNLKNDFVRSFPNDKNSVSNFLIGSEVTDVRRRGKVIFIDLSTKYTLMIHLRMTGQLVFVDSNDARFGAGHPSKSLINKLPDKSTRVSITFSDKSHLYFNDQRKFGWMKLLSSKTIKDDKFISKLGPEPLKKSFTLKLFQAQLSRRSESIIKATLLDQTVIAGIGNIYADESLWMAEVHPSTKVKNLTEEKIKTLRRAIVAVLNASLQAGGSTDKNYVNARGEKGGYLAIAHVFRREGRPCFRCGNVIVKIRVAGRGTHICSNCQVK